MKGSRRIWIVLAFCLLMVFMLGCSVLASIAGPTPTPTPIPPTATPTPPPVYLLKGRLLFKEGNAAVADTTLIISNEEGVLSFGAGGKFENPQGKTDADGRFEIEMDENFLKKHNYKVIVFVSLYNASSFANKLYPLRDDNGILIVIELPTNPILVDLGDVYVR